MTTCTRAIDFLTKGMKKKNKKQITETKNRSCYESLKNWVFRYLDVLVLYILTYSLLTTKSWVNLVYFLFPFCFVVKAQIVLLRQSLPQMNICFGEQILMKIVILQEIFLLSGEKTTVDLCIGFPIRVGIVRPRI